MAGFTYKSYSFTDKDPIIDEVATAIKDSGVNYKWIENESGVTSATLHNWFYGSTKKPQAATINAVLHTLGYKLSLVPYKTAVHFNPPMPASPRVASPRMQAREIRHVIQMAKFKKGARK
jgi:DNA-binding phage protein